ncbi:hypothetical protein Tco_0355395 [Tanacetum coccineum]
MRTTYRDIYGEGFYERCRNSWGIGGSNNGLVCIYHSSSYDYRICVTNPLTREFKELQKPGPYDVRHEHCLGFGYDSSTDDYKVVMTVCQQGLVRAGLVSYSMGALHWFWFDANDITPDKEIKEIEEVYSEEDRKAEEEEKQKERLFFHRQSTACEEINNAAFTRKHGAVKAREVYSKQELLSPLFY